MAESINRTISGSHGFNRVGVRSARSGHGIEVDGCGRIYRFISTGMTVILQPSGPRMATAFMIQSTSAHSILSYVVQSLLILGQSIAMWKVRKEKRFHLLAAWVDAITFACPSCVHLEHVGEHIQRSKLIFLCLERFCE